MGRRWGTQSRLEYIERLTNETVHFDYNDKTFENSCSIAHNLTETVSKSPTARRCGSAVRVDGLSWLIRSRMACPQIELSVSLIQGVRRPCC